MFGLALVDVAVLFVYLTAITALGIATARGVRSLGDYLMGGRRFGKTFLVMHSFGTGTHTDQPVAVTGAAYEIGLAGIWYQWLWLFATPFYWLIAPIFRRFRYLTMGDFFAQRYGTSLEVFYALVSMLVLMLQMGLMLQGMGRTVEGLTGGCLPMQDVVIVTALLFTLYSFAGGLVAAVVTDFIQGFFIILLSFLILPLAYAKLGGLHALQSEIGPEMFSLVAPREVTLFYVVTVVINALIGVPVQPHSLALGGAGRNELDARVGLTYGNFLKRLCTLGWALTGLYAIALYPGLSHRELAFGHIARNLLPTGLVGLMLAAVFAAVMSTCDSITVAGSGLFTHNLYRKFLVKRRTEKHYLTVGRVAGIFLALGGVLFALVFPSVVSMLEYFWKVTAFLGIAFWGGLLWPRANRTGAWASALVAAAVAFYLEIHGGYGLAVQIALYLPAGILALVLGSLLTRPEPEERLRAFYATIAAPVGSEEELSKSGVGVVYSGRAPRSTSADRLVLADIPLGRKISWRTHRTDLLGFLVAWAVVLVLLGCTYLLSAIGRGTLFR